MDAQDAASCQGPGAMSRADQVCTAKRRQKAAEGHANALTSRRWPAAVEPFKERTRLNVTARD